MVRFDNKIIGENMGKKRYALTNDPESIQFMVRLNKPDNIMLEKLAAGTCRSKVGMIRSLIQKQYSRELEIK